MLKYSKFFFFCHLAEFEFHHLVGVRNMSIHFKCGVSTGRCIHICVLVDGPVYINPTMSVLLYPLV